MLHLEASAAWSTWLVCSPSLSCLTWGITFSPLARVFLEASGHIWSADQE